MGIMTPKHPKWREFIKRLCGPEGLNFKKVDGRWEWSCDNTMERPIAHRILTEHYPEVDVEATMQYFDDHGGYCDCEIVHNVDE